jgi:hypothetical protein
MFSIVEQLKACQLHPLTEEERNRPMLATLLRQLPLDKEYTVKQLSDMTGYSCARVGAQLHTDAIRYGTFQQVKKGRGASWKRIK